jgi:5-methylcytosine-specific restriction endonuclease McrA
MIQRAQPKWNQRTKSRRTQSPNESFYKQKEWTSTSKAFREANPICAWYGKRPKCSKHSKITDHIVSITDGGDPMNTNNFQALCLSCSAAKTNMEKQNRETGMKRKITPNGLV